MNGRIYDAKLGRFLQADPFIQAPYNTQSHNRYSYTLNNPLNATDPDGFFFKKLFKIVVAAVITYVTWGAASAWAAGTTWGAAGGGLSVAGGMAAGAMAGAAGGFASGLMATGSLSGAISGAAWGALAGAAFGGIGVHFGEGLSVGKLAADGLAGGILSDLQGGKFGHGFVSGGISTLAGGAPIGGGTVGQAIKRALVSAVAGGTISKLTGEKFANGARTAAFVSLMNSAVKAYQSRPDKGLDSNGVEVTYVDDEIYPDGMDGNGNTILAQEDVLSLKKSYRQCHIECISDNYGQSYEVAKDLSIFSLPSVGIEIGAKVLDEKLLVEARRNAYQGGNDSKKFNAGHRQWKTLTQFRKFNAAGAVIGVGAAGFQSGAKMYCAVEVMMSGCAE